MSDDILSAFDERNELYKNFTIKAASLIREILAGNNINVHSVTYRTKDRQSLARKLLKRGASYQSIEDITDIAGVRITTYFEDDVNKVTQILRREFEIDEKNSVDKRTLLDPDRFGYLSTHHVVKLISARCDFLEYQRYAALKLEVQTRSILQHAWAEIEHDLGYKSILEVPKEIRRRFSRLSSLLELADSEFIGIRDQLQSYNSTVLEKISTRADTADINKDTLLAFIRHNQIIRRIDQQIVELTSAELSEEGLNTEIILDILDFYNIKTVGQLQQSLLEQESHTGRFAQAMINRYPPADGKVRLTRGSSILFMGYLLAAEASNPNVLDNYMKKLDVVGENLAAEIRALFANVVFPQAPSK